MTREEILAAMPGCVFPDEPYNREDFLMISPREGSPVRIFCPTSGRYSRLYVQLRGVVGASEGSASGETVLSAIAAHRHRNRLSAELRCLL